jgi:hypothetical protein
MHRTGFSIAVVLCALAIGSPVRAQITVVRKPAPSAGPDEYVTYDIWYASWGLRDDPPDQYPLGSATYSTEDEARRAAADHIARTAGNGAGAVTHYLIEGEATVHKKGGPTLLHRANDGLHTVKEAKDAVDHAKKVAKGEEPLLRATERKATDTLKEYKDMIRKSVGQAVDAKKTLTGGVSGLTDAKFKQMTSAVNQNKRDAQDAWTRWNDAFKPIPGAATGPTAPTTSSASPARNATTSISLDPLRAWSGSLSARSAQSGQLKASFNSNTIAARSSARPALGLDGTVLARPSGADPRTVWLSKMKTYVDTETARLQRYDRWLRDEDDKLGREYKWLTNAYNNLADQARNWLCPRGFTLDGCFARPPVCDEAVAFRSWYSASLDNLNRRYNAAVRRSRELDGYAKRYLAEKSKLRESRARYQAELDKDSSRFASKTTRSPFEGLFPTTPAQKPW